MSRVVEAVYEQGVFRPLEPLSLPEGQRVALSVEPQGLTSEEAGAQLEAWRQVYEGLTEEAITEIESIALDRSHFLPPIDSGLTIG